MQFDQLRRREFITLLGGSVAVCPFAAGAQQPAMPVIGYLGSESPDLVAGRLHAFRQGLSEAGYLEGRNVAIEYRWAEDRYDRLPALAADLARRQLSAVAVPASVVAALAAKAAITRIPVVFGTAGDPVQLGLVASLNRPGGNFTGVSSLNTEVEPKRLELLHELVPTAATIALLLNPTGRFAGIPTKEVQAAARTLGVQLHVLHASTERDFDAAFATLVQLRIGALLIGGDAFFTSRLEQLAALAAHHAVPTIYQYREFTAAGGLMSYGSNISDQYRMVGGYVGRILKGEKPADLPVQQSVKVELFINMKTAKTLGLTVPLPLRGRADELIE